MTKILIADDDKLSLRLLESTLKKAGYEVIPVQDGAEAKNLLCRHEGPRLALLDWIMPNLDGPAVVRAVRAQHDMPYVHIILLTSRQSKEDLIAGLESGADDYLTKPFHPEELLARLRTGKRILQLEDKLVEAREEMRFKATHDPLTSLWNRSTIMDILQREMARARRNRENSSVTVVLGDIDHFKDVNDNYGHAAGDEVLREVASRIGKSVRNYDAVARYGGEEFLLVLHGCGASWGAERAEDVRRFISDHPVQCNAASVNVSMSLGVAGTDDWPKLDAERLIHEADIALYRAKSSGRNLVVLARPSGPEEIRTQVPVLPAVADR